MVRFNTLSTLSSGGATGVMGRGIPPTIFLHAPSFFPPQKKNYNSVKIRPNLTISA